MKQDYLEAGKVINTHGIRGELKIQPWCDSPEFLCGCHTLYLDQKPFQVLSSRIHKGNVLVTLSGIESVEDAQAMKNKIVFLARADITLPEGRSFVADLIGLDVLEEATGARLGQLAEIRPYPAQDLYVVRGEREYLIPDVDEFIREINPEEGYIKVRLLDGM